MPPLWHTVEVVGLAPARFVTNAGIETLLEERQIGIILSILTVLDKELKVFVLYLKDDKQEKS